MTTARTTVLDALRDAGQYPDTLQITHLQATDALLVVSILDDDTHTHRIVTTRPHLRAAAEAMADAPDGYLPECLIYLDDPADACVAQAYLNGPEVTFEPNLTPFTEDEIAVA